MRQLTSEMQIPARILALMTESEGALNLSKTSNFHQQSRYNEHRFHYLKQESNKGHYTIHHIPGKKDPSDILTKITPKLVDKYLDGLNEWEVQW
jgi:hypothetical protein